MEGGNEEEANRMIASNRVGSDLWSFKNTSEKGSPEKDA